VRHVGGYISGVSQFHSFA